LSEREIRYDEIPQAILHREIVACNPRRGFISLM